MGIETDFAELLQCARAGYPGAAQALYDRFREPLLRVIRRYLDRRLRPAVDPIDFLQEVWLSFLRTSLQEESFTTPEQLLAFLVRVAHHKVVNANRHHLDTQKSGRGHLSSLDDAAVNEGELASRRPSPEQLAVAKDEWEKLLEGKNPIQRQVLDLRREGYTPREIADRLHAHEKTIRRFLQSLRARRGPPC